MERALNEEDLRHWSDHIPLEWKYTAGVAGERFLQLLKQGALQGSLCKNCNKMFLPPKIFCKDCFVQLNDWKDIPLDSGYVYSYTKVPSGGADATILLVKFNGVEGGLLGKFKAGREEPRIGMKVKAVFKQKQERQGALSDIMYFEKV